MDQDFTILQRMPTSSLQTTAPHEQICTSSKSWPASFEELEELGTASPATESSDVVSEVSSSPVTLRLPGEKSCCRADRPVRGLSLLPAIDQCSPLGGGTLMQPPRVAVRCFSGGGEYVRGRGTRLTGHIHCRHPTSLLLCASAGVIFL